MALFLVDRQMYHEASEIFYSHAHFLLYGDDFSQSLAILRQFPLDSLQRIRRLEFIMTVAQCDRWGVGALASGYLEDSYIAISQHHWDGYTRPEHDYQADWQAIVDFLADNADLPRLSITINIRHCGWEFQDISDMIMWERHEHGFRLVQVRL